jgi:hypothetical protein
MSAQTPQILGTGIANAVWGISSVAYTGFCKSITITRNGEESKIFDGNGFTIGIILFDDKDEGTVEMVLQTTDEIPTRGTVVTVAGIVSFIVLTHEKMWNWRDQAQWKFTVVNFVNLVTS